MKKQHNPTTHMGQYALCGLLTLLALGIIYHILPQSASSHAHQGDPLRIMPVGESIVKGLCDVADNCNVPPAPIPRDCIDPVNVNPDAIGFRGYLQDYLDTDPAIPYDFVGSLSNGASSGIDPDHEGHGAWFIPNLTNCIGDWVQTAQPDIILLHVGTNDLLQVWLTNPTDPTDPIHVQTAVSDLHTLLDTIYTTAPPTTRVILAQIIRSGGQGADSYNDLIVTYNQEIANLVETLPCRSQLIPLTNMYPVVTSTHIAPLPADSAFPYQHPTPAGYDLMAQTWHTAIRQLLDEGNLDTPCHFNTRTYDGNIESITANGRYWNFAPDGTLTSHAPLDTINRYRDQICPHNPDPTTPCIFDTRNLTAVDANTQIETITAYGQQWQFQLTPNIQLLNTASLTTIYPTICAYSPDETCQLDTLVHFDAASSPISTPFTTITAYGRLWNIPQITTKNHKTHGPATAYLPFVRLPLTNDTPFLITDVPLTTLPWHQTICAHNPDPATPCTFDTRTFLPQNEGILESITAYGHYWNITINHPNLPNGTIQSTGRLTTINKY